VCGRFRWYYDPIVSNAASDPQETRLVLPDGLGLAPGRGTIDLVLHTEPGTELSMGSPVRAAIEVESGDDLLIVPEPRLGLDAVGGPVQPVAIPVQVKELPAAEIAAELRVTIEYVTCDAQDVAACAPGRARLRVPVRLLREGGRTKLSLRVALPR
jgi:hypothetical protein